jgi:hypothetical protein
MFHLRVSTPVKADGITVIPEGADAFGEVVDAAPGGFSGRPGKLILSARYIEIGGKRLPLRHFHWGQAGRDRTTMALVVGAVVGLPAIFISGGNIDVPIGTPVSAKLTEEATVDLPPPSNAPALSESFNHKGVK